MYEGNGSRQPAPVLILAGVSTVVALVVSAASIYLQLRNYRKPALQRMVIRIMVMIPIYAVASFISLFSLRAAFFIDAVRDIYEAFVIYCFFSLLLTYLGGERSLLIMVHGRMPKEPPFPINFFKREIDPSDPYLFLFLKRGILQYVQVKPILAVITMILKAVGKYGEGNLTASSGYLWISIVYNTSICLSLYCLALFWICVNDDLKPFRPVPKFLCVKGILFFSFWQSIGISILVAAGAITALGPYTDKERISIGLTDTLICVEMPLFAFAHWFAFSYKDFIDKNVHFVARMPIYYALRDSFGLLDVLEDSKATLRGEGMDYREFEPSEGVIHQGEGRDRRIRAGLRYSKGGKRKYWLPQPTTTTRPPGRLERGINNAIKRVAGVDQSEDVHAPLLEPQAEQTVHLADDYAEDEDEGNIWESPRIISEHSGFDLPFGDLDENDEQLFTHCKQYLFGDYNYPCVDVSSETARLSMWDEEERVLRDEHGAWFSPLRGARGRVALGQREGRAWEGYGAVGSTSTRPRNDHHPNDNQGPERVIDFAQDKAPAAEPTDVRLKWTKDKAKSPSVTRIQSPAMSRTSSGTSRQVKSPKLREDVPRPLPPDAVDLVVEDNSSDDGAAPTSPNKLRKVYRKGFVERASDGEEERGEVEVEEPGDQSGRRVDDGEEVLEALDRDAPIVLSRSPDHTKPTPSAPETVARAITPPPHAQGLDHDNPWA